MRIFKYRLFHDWAKDQEIDNKSLKDAVSEIQQGLFDANLGSGLYKKRVSRKGQGKRSGYRMLIAYRKDEKAIFMYGFAKKERQNITEKESKIYKKLSKYYLSVTDIQLNILITNRELIKVIHEKK